MLLLDETMYRAQEDALQVAPTGTPKASGMAALKLPVDVAGAALLIAGGVESLATGGESTALFELYDEEIRPVQEKLTPEPGSVTMAGQFVAGIAGFAPALALGPGAIPVLAGSGAINMGADLTEQGVGPGAATGAGVLMGGSIVAMGGIPAAGKTWGRTLALAAANPVIGAASVKAEKELLEAAGYEEVAKQFNPFDLVGRGIDAVFGVAFGAMGKYSLARQQMRAQVKDSIDVVANWQRMFKDTPFDTSDPKTADLGYKAMQKALSDISAGKPVDLSGVLPDAPKLQQPDAPVRAEVKEARKTLAESLERDAEIRTERRGQFDDDVVLREALQNTPREQIHDMILTEPVSGARTRTAFEILQKQQPAEMLGISDARGLGAIDKHLGHKAGDDFTRMIVKAHQEESVPVYRASDKGDEFITRWNGFTKEQAYAKLEAVNNRLRKSILEVTNPDGSKRYFTNLELYVGLGKGEHGYEQAGHAVGEQKRTNQPAGYVKGEFPRHLVELSQERGVAAARGDREAAPRAEGTAAAEPAETVKPAGRKPRREGRPQTPSSETARPAMSGENLSPKNPRGLLFSADDAHVLEGALSGIRDAQAENYTFPVFDAVGNPTGEVALGSRQWSTYQEANPWLEGRPPGKSAEILQKALQGEWPRPHAKAQWQLIYDALDTWKMENQPDRSALWSDPLIGRVESALLAGDEPQIRTGTDADGRPLETPVRDFIEQAKQDYKALEAQQDVYRRIGDCIG